MPGPLALGRDMGDTCLHPTPVPPTLGNTSQRREFSVTTTPLSFLSYGVTGAVKCEGTLPRSLTWGTAGKDTQRDLGILLGTLMGNTREAPLLVPPIAQSWWSARKKTDFVIKSEFESSSTTYSLRDSGTSLSLGQPINQRWYQLPQRVLSAQ